MYGLARRLGGPFTCDFQWFLIDFDSSKGLRDR